MLHAGFISFRASSTHEAADGNNEKDRIYPVADPPGYAVMLGFYCGRLLMSLPLHLRAISIILQCFVLLN